MTESVSSPDEHVYMTTAMLKALAHPLRRRITKVIARREFARAADIAAELDVPANSVSFHLRVLADAGLIVEAPEHARDRRDRVWRAVQGGYNVGSPEHPVEDEVLGGALMHTLAEDHFDLVRRVLAWAPEYVSGRTAEVHGTFSQRTVRLTEAEFTAVEEKIYALFAEVEAAHDRTDPAGRMWGIDIVAADDTI
ncbi:ArsR/SmtB family transcription factor [Microbacterium esteraromaticum]|nr:helix-turn-helix domain-containing protein [Microbacterium esteraromaticum]